MKDIFLFALVTGLYGLAAYAMWENNKKQRKIMAQLDELQAQVEKNTQVEASALTLIQGLHEQLVAAGTDPGKLQALKQSLAASGDALAAAVAANTPATEATPETPAEG